LKLYKIYDDIFVFRDYVNVYAIKNKDRAILIDFASGKVLDHLSEIGIRKVDYIFHTHYHRDQCFGDTIALKRRIKIAAPEKEKRLFNEAEEFWKTISYDDLYYFKPTYFVSPYNISLDKTFTDGELFEWDPFQFNILETSGHTTGSVSYLLEVDNKKIAFTGDLINKEVTGY
jgi:glyoxylase-like metal-dependent hydrolase (beta-lactamase superfamily II)